ncbi:MAG: Tfp pilus assembly protein FimT/FimU [Candidatus Magasanikbacteria bacterium]
MNHLIKKVLNFELEEKSGFTLVEVIVVMGIVFLLSTLAVGYSRSSDDQLRLFKERAKLVGVINRARSMTVERYFNYSGSVPCAFGIHFERGSNKYILFRDLAGSSDPSDCGQSNNEAFDGGNEEIKEFQLPSRINFKGSSSFNILFIAPYIDVSTSLSGSSPFPVTVCLKELDSGNEVPISISKAGQVSTGGTCS